MSIKIRKELNDIIQLHQRIVNALKSQKVRQDQMIEKYQETLEGEMEIPSNKFMYWTRSVSPYIDSVISSKLMDFELIKEYEKFIKDVLGYEQDFIISEAEVADLEYNFDLIIESILRLETKLHNTKKEFTNELARAKIHSIKMYQSLPEKKRNEEGVCEFCGIELDENLGDSDTECIGCSEIPPEMKPFLNKPRQRLKSPKAKIPKPFLEKKSEETLDNPTEESDDESKDEKEKEPDKQKDTLKDSDDESFIEKEDLEIDDEKAENDNRQKAEIEEDVKLRKEFNKLMGNFKKKHKKVEEKEEDIFEKLDD